MFKPNKSFVYLRKSSPRLGVQAAMSRPQKNRITGGGLWRKKQERIDEPDGFQLDDLGNI